MHIMSTNFGKTLVWKYEYEAKLGRHKRRTPNTNDHHMPLNETPHENFLRTPLLPAHELRLVSVQWTVNLAAFPCRQWFMDLRRLSLMSIYEMLAYRRWWIAWREASCCLGHSDIFHLIF